MKTDRLYYNAPHLLQFDATIIETRPMANGFGVILDKTAFYPTSGGQPNDLGTINDVPLLDCLEDEATGSIFHVVNLPLPAGPAHCRIDAARRSDHMQQHSGQHVLSQAFVELFNWPTLSFHMGTVTCTIDLPAESISREQAERAEDLANRVVRENRNVAIHYVSQENVAEAGLRKPSERAGEIRVIDINGYDRSACGGTHVRMTRRNRADSYHRLRARQEANTGAIHLRRPGPTVCPRGEPDAGDDQSEPFPRLPWRAPQPCARSGMNSRLEKSVLKSWKTA